LSAPLHFNICRETGVQLDKKHWYEHLPKSVQTSQVGKATILWNQQIKTDRIIPSNKTDIVICDNKNGTCMLIDVVIPRDRNVIQKEAEKILKYKGLTTEIQCMWNVKSRLIPVITGAIGAISKSFKTIPGNHKVKELQKTVILGTARIFRKVLM
jgi:hypothetical protein